jgi:hypothetical protein
MTKRSRVIMAVAVGIIGLSSVVAGVGGNDPSLNAVGAAETGVDIVKFLVWGGIAALVISAVLFISASAE